MIFLKTQRLTLRNVAAKDADTIFDYRNNVLCARYQRNQTKTYDGICELIETHKHDILSVDAPVFIAVALTDTGEMIGEIVMMPNEDTISLGYTFHYHHHRKGYAYEALHLLTDLLHEQYPDWDFICFTEPENEPSMALLRKLGYRDMGYLPRLESRVFGKWLTAATEAELAQAMKA